MSENSHYTIILDVMEEIISSPDSKVENVLQSLKKSVDAEDVRFRPVDWKGKSVVYVPGWSVPEETEEVDLDLYRRIFFDPKEPLRLDCLVGLVARIARIRQEEIITPRSALLDQLKEGVVNDDIKEPNYIFNNVKEREVFRDLINRLDARAKKYKNIMKRWEAFYERIKDIPKNKDFFNCVEKVNPPWQENGGNIEQWNSLQASLASPVEENFVKKVKETAGYYGRLYKQSEEYLKKRRENPGCEISVPVIAAGKLLGILNLHRNSVFGENDYMKNTSPLREEGRGAICT